MPKTNLGRVLPTKGFDIMNWTEITQASEAADRLASLPDQFVTPADMLYFDGNSLGLMSIRSQERIQVALDEWANLAVLGWDQAVPPWLTRVEEVSALLAPLIGAIPGEVTLGSSTTVMLHQLLATFYQGGSILIDGLAFPTDRYAVESFLQSRMAGERLVVVPPASDGLLDPDEILRKARRDVTLAVLPSVVFTTGQRLPIVSLTRELRRQGIFVIWDLSHSAGLFPHRLHDVEVDAAVFCTYKYLHGGPGSPGAAFVHRRHWPLRPGLQGWWGSAHDQQFRMTDQFLGAPDTHALQLGTPSILALAALEGSLLTLNEVGIENLWQRSTKLVHLLQRLVEAFLVPYGVKIVTPASMRGGHLALSHPCGRDLSTRLRQRRVVADFRYPDIIRLAPVPTTTRWSGLLETVVILQAVLTDGPSMTSIPPSLVP